MLVDRRNDANSAFGAVFSHHDCGMSVDCSTLYSRLCMAGTVLSPPRALLPFPEKSCLAAALLAVLVMTLLLVMVFIIPSITSRFSVVDGSGPLIKAISSGDMTLPNLAWLNTIPVIGAKLLCGWHNLLDMGGRRSWRKSALILAPPPPGSIRASGAYRALYGALCADASTSVPCCSGAVNSSTATPFCDPSGRRSRRCRRTAGGTGYPRGGAGCGGDGVSTGSAWRYRPRRIRRTLCNVANGVNDPSSCLVQLGVPVLIPAIIWLYWTGDLHLGNGIVSVSGGWHAG